MAEEGKLPAFRRILTYPQTQTVCYKCKYQRNYNQLINNGSDAPRLHQKMGIVQRKNIFENGMKYTYIKHLMALIMKIYYHKKLRGLGGLGV